MKVLQVVIERNGAMHPVGEILGDDPNTAVFRYSTEYLEGSMPSPISISLPLRDTPFSPKQTAAFFEGLLPEGFTRRAVAQWLRSDEGDYLRILHGLGRECLGALCVTEPGEELCASYESLSKQQVKELAAEGATKSAELVTKTHLSLTGASGKVGLYYDAAHDVWYLPKGSAPSTHIVKQSHIRLDDIVTNERLALMTAARCGIEVSPSFIVNVGTGKEDEVLFATQRYDRSFDEGSRILDGLPCPLRLHQEDFAQAMGVPSSMKYETESSGYLRRMFEILRIHSSDPMADQLKLWDMVVFDYLIGNTDAHIKNFSLLYGSDLKTIRLAPAYDLVSTTVYEQSTRDMAFGIGDTTAIDEITSESFTQAAREAGLGIRLAMERYGLMVARFPDALQRSATELANRGYPRAKDMEARIMRSGGICHAL